MSIDLDKTSVFWRKMNSLDVSAVLYFLIFIISFQNLHTQMFSWIALKLQQLNDSALYGDWTCMYNCQMGTPI